METKFSKIKDKEFNKIISKFINPKIYIDFDKYYEEEFKQIYIRGEYIPYIISSFGRIFSVYFKSSKSINIRELKTNISKKGYERITLCYHNKVHSYQIHVLLALVFIENDDIEHKIQVNHIDGIKTHNYIWNLEWVTPKENIQHAEIHELTTHVYGTKHGRNKFSEDDIRKVCELLEENKLTIKEISKITNVSSKLIYRIYKKKVWLSISKDYNIDKFDNIETVSDEYKKEREKQIRLVCELLQEGKYSMPEISKITSVKYKLVNQILHKNKYIKIVNDYDFSNFNKYKNK